MDFKRGDLVWLPLSEKPQDHSLTLRATGRDWTWSYFNHLSLQNIRDVAPALTFRRDPLPGSCQG